MGNKKKGNAKKKFNRATGKHCYKVKVRNTKALHRQAKKVESYSREKITVAPYQIVQRQHTINGKCTTRFTVRRIPLHLDRKTRTIKLGATSLYFKRPELKTFTGNRIIDIDNLKEHVIDITLHSATCEKAQALARKGEPCITLTHEKKQDGMYSILGATCKGCKKAFELESSKRSSGNNMPEINIRAVWGTITTGGGHSRLQEFCGTLNMPSVKQGPFSKIEMEICKWWETAFKEEVVKAGMEERRLAIERGDFHDGIPAITVICDGGWSKRSHKHSYNASGGVGVIFGAATQKLLYLGVRNRYCYLCEKGQSPSDHTCYKNWSESSQSMESDMILEGFLEAESVHGLRYTKVIADGDSSVYNNIVENVPVWGHAVKKMECANHACKCLRTNLERLVAEKPEYKGKGKLTKQTRVRLTTAVRCAIRMRSENRNVRLLKKDIRNSIYHVFGFHENCSDFCKNRPEKDHPDVNEDLEEKDSDSEDLFDNMSEFWSTASDADMNESRLAGKETTSDVRNIIRDVSIYLNRLAEKSERLIGNFTTNLAESWMNIRCKFDGGKFVNRCNRGSWHTRCIGGALRKNLGPAWSPLVFQKVTNDRPGYFFIDTFRQKAKHHASVMKTQQGEKAKLKRRKRKHASMSRPSKKARLDYGPSVLSDTPDVAPEKLETLEKNFVDKVLVKSTAEIQNTEKHTKDQHLSEKWKRERRVRLTSSNFGKIFKRKSNNISTSVTKNLLYSTFKGNMCTVRGLAQEANTVIEYKNTQSHVKEVESMGLMICHSHPYLAASTDGKVVQHNGDVGLLEIKNVLGNNKLSFKEASTSKSNFCLKINKNGDLKLKTNHDYYYQCQGQMNIFEQPWLDFVVRRTDPYEIHIERIVRDFELWQLMLPKLEAFFWKFLLPELALPRYGTVTGLRQPHCPWYEEKSTQKRNPSRVLIQHRRSKAQPTPVCDKAESAQLSVSEGDASVRPGPSTQACPSSKQKAQSKRGTAAKKPQQEEQPPVTGSANLSLDANIIEQVNKIRDLKSAKAAKTDIDAAVKALLALKAKYKAATGNDWKSSHQPVAKATASTTYEGSNHTDELNKKITAQGNIVNVVPGLKAKKASKDGEEADCAVTNLLVMKGEHKAAKGKDWKPGRLHPVTKATDPIPQPSGSSNQISRRRRTTKFVGRTVSHLCVDKSSKATRWLKGTVLDVKKGKDGASSAVYEVLYEGENLPRTVESLAQDFLSGSIKFIDV